MRNVFPRLKFQSPSFRGGSTPARVREREAARSRVSIPFVSGREHSLYPKVALTIQQHTVYFSRTSQNNAFLSPSPDSFPAPKTAPTPFLPIRSRHSAHPPPRDCHFPNRPTSMKTS